MNTKQTIAITGAASNKGAPLALCLATGNYRLLLQDYNAKILKKLLKLINLLHASADVALASCATEAGWEADIIIIDDSLAADKILAEKIKVVANQKIVMVLENNVVNTYLDEVNAECKIVAEELQLQLPNSKLIKVLFSGNATDYI